MLAAAAAMVAGCATVTPGEDDVIIENARFRLVAGADAKVKSLVLKATGEECAAGAEGIPLFSVTQDRPFNNEVKLIHPNKRTTYWANRLRRSSAAKISGVKWSPAVGAATDPTSRA